MKKAFAILLSILLLSEVAVLAESENPGLRTYSVASGTLSVTLDDTDMNILLPEMAADDPSVLRSGKTAEEITTFLTDGKFNLLLYHPWEAFPGTFSIVFRVKDQIYSGVDLRTLDDEKVQLYLDSLFDSYGEMGAEHPEKTVINGVPYLVFDWPRDNNQQRYVTIVNGYAVYIFAQKTGIPLTDAERALLRQVVEAIAWPE